MGPINGCRAVVRVQHQHHTRAGIEPVIHLFLNFRIRIAGKYDFDSEIWVAGPQSPRKPRLRNPLAPDKCQVWSTDGVRIRGDLESRPGCENHPEAMCLYKLVEGSSDTYDDRPMLATAGIRRSSPLTSSYRKPSSGSMNSSSAVTSTGVVLMVTSSQPSYAGIITRIRAPRRKFSRRAVVLPRSAPYSAASVGASSHGTSTVVRTRCKMVVRSAASSAASHWRCRRYTRSSVQPTTSRRRAKWSNGGISGGVRPICCVMVLTCTSAAAGWSGQRAWWMSPRHTPPWRSDV
jgi:hypothetical protein